ncbi:MAG TPA: hypothetical protein VLJ88_11845 [Propionibacteriaceae bacterium]|nr:hypothetical protein [Propionibacteriaceae bacterium]
MRIAVRSPLARPRLAWCGHSGFTARRFVDFSRTKSMMCRPGAF